MSADYGSRSYFSRPNRADAESKRQPNGERQPRVPVKSPTNRKPSDPALSHPAHREEEELLDGPPKSKRVHRTRPDFTKRSTRNDDQSHLHRVSDDLLIKKGRLHQRHPQWYGQQSRQARHDREISRDEPTPTKRCRHR